MDDTGSVMMLNSESVDQDVESAPRHSCPPQQKPNQAAEQARGSVAAHAETRSVSAKAAKGSVKVDLLFNQHEHLELSSGSEDPLILRDSQLDKTSASAVLWSSAPWAS